METKDKIILVTGATAKQGGTVARHLLGEGWKVRALTRNPDKAVCNELKSLGAQIVKGDLDDPVSLENALRGVYGVFSVQQYYKEGVGTEVRWGKNMAREAAKSGVDHFVYSSISGANSTTGIPHFDSKAKIEEFVRKSGVKYTIVRPVYFMENFLAVKDKIYDGTLYLGLRPDVPLQMLALDDLGAFVAMVFNNPDKFFGAEIDLAGDELTGPEMAAVFSSAIGRDVGFKQRPIEEYRLFSSDVAMMFDWFNLKGFQADIAALEQWIPHLKSFDNWVRSSGWHKAAA